MDDKDFSGLVNTLVGILGDVAVILFGLAVLVFVWGMAQTVMNSDNAEARKKGRQLAVWGAIGLFVITAVWGLVYLVSDAIFDRSELEGDRDILDPVLVEPDFGRSSEGF